MCFKNGKKLHINDCLTYQLINVEIYSSLGSYLCEKKLTKYKENILIHHISNLNIQTYKQLAQTSLSHTCLE